METTIIEQLIGKTFTSVTGQAGGEEMMFKGSEVDYRFYHYQDCCESVEIIDIIGDLSDLENSPILQAEEVTKEADSKIVSDSGTWTFYKFATIKGYVTVRWLGESNGYYSESVDFEEIKESR